MQPKKLFIAAIAAMFVVSTVGLTHVEAKGGRKSSSSRSSSFGGSKKSSGSSFFGGSSKPKTYSSKPKTTGSKSYSSGSKSNTSSSSKPKTTGSKSYSFGSSTSSNSSKPVSSGSSRATSNKSAASKKVYTPTKKATSPPKSSYVAPNGKKVNVRKDSKVTEKIRSQPSTNYTPAARTQRTTVHITNYGYSHPYNYYHSQPSYYVGGGYSSAFWWMMMEWSAERRARWFYNNQNNIEQDAYERGMKDAAVSAELARLKAENAVVNPDYVDSEFQDNPDLMYSQDYVEAAYNPVVKTETLTPVAQYNPPVQNSGPSVFVYLIAFLILGFVVYFIFFRRYGV